LNNPDISILICAYNSDKSLEILTKNIIEIFSNLEETFNIIFVDDGSSNKNTWTTIESLHSAYPKLVKGYSLMRNFGRPSALLCGFKKCDGKYLIMMDDDLQHDPYYIPEFLKYKIHDVVIAHFVTKEHNFIKRTFSDIKGYFDYKLIGKPKDIKNSSYKMIKRPIIDSINQMNIFNPFISGLLFHATRDLVNVKIIQKKREYGKSGFTLNKMLSQFMNLMFNNSSFMLRVISYLGILFSFFGLILTLFYLYRYVFYDSNVPGWTSLIVLNLVTSGIILFSLGVFGEYFIRIIKLAENRPSYVIRSKCE